MLSKISKYNLEAGVDEAGRGCIAGPVFAAAVILPENFSHPLIKDSKKLTALQREEARKIIEANAISYAVAHISNEIIDEVNILQATMMAMHRALALLAIQPQFIVVDGNYFIRYRDLSYQTIKKADNTYCHVAAASILAKTYRDEYMTMLHDDYPMYQWSKNKGYPTKLHRQAILDFGISPYHRKSFKLL
ncbi:MAG: ribonuclease HII [Bacteroidales bacterium]|nr:ribonuclease HII [Bacteroidales bacterium]MDI9575697.1 ribonuclease HII [Bacteroidota bacterium]MDD2594131.1 ribonuclease HII [Bacteroidales bacterium]MDD3756070.1 ribonuclease HII [Bacteroidales bacterium]MDY0400221.1 ribonuclease HII [Bacteroidales bacterium]